MNLRVSPDKRNGRKYLTIVKSYRDKDTKRPKSRTVLSLGYLDALEKEHPDPIAHFKEVARRMTEEEGAVRKTSLALSLDEPLPQGGGSRKNYGYAAIMKIFHELGLREFLAAKARPRAFEFNTGSIMLLLVVSRILSPGSKKKAFEERGRYFERFGFSLADVYRALSHFAGIAREAQRHVREKVEEICGRDMSLVYFDSTNFYFEIDGQDDLRRRGVSKEHRPNPIVQMGLAMDREGMPIGYEIFPGNRPDAETFREVVGRICKEGGAGRVVAVGDMGIINGDNIWYLIGGRPESPRHGYVFAFSVRGGAEDFKQWALDGGGYVGEDGKPAEEGALRKTKSRVVAREIFVTRQRDGKKMRKTVYEKQVATWSQKYADKAKAEREAVLRKALAFVREPSKYKKHSAHGAGKYILGVDRETGEIDPKRLLSIDFEAVREDEALDGYHAVVTSERDMGDAEVLAAYRGLWEIEEAFRVAKGDLGARPVHVSREDRIEAHFLTCFIALLVIRLLRKRTGKAYSAARLIDAMNRVSCSNVQENIYLFDYRSEVTDAIGAAVGVDFTRKHMLLSEMKKILGDVKN